MIGYLAKSKVGHDKNCIYIIIEETEDFVYVVDGKYKKMCKPKKKNKKHIQVWKLENDLLSEIKKKLINKDNIRDEEIKRAIKLSSESKMEE